MKDQVKVEIEGMFYCWQGAITGSLVSLFFGLLVVSNQIFDLRKAIEAKATAGVRELTPTEVRWTVENAPRPPAVSEVKP